LQSNDINGGASVAHTDRDKLLGNSGSTEADDKKKKMLKWGIIGGLVLIITILAIVLPLTLRKKPPPNPIGPTPLPGGLMNPYSTVGG
jgi:hypothetical protein